MSEETLVKLSELDQYVGFVAPPTDWFTVTQDQINEFANCTLDQQFIHVDPVKAAETPFGTTIAHGFLSLSMLAHFGSQFGIAIEGAYMGVNYGFDSVRFIAPVKSGGRIRALAKIVEVEERKPGQVMMKTEVTIEIEGSKQPALVANWLTLQMVK